MTSSFLERELAKTAFEPYHEMRGAITKAYADWLRRGRDWIVERPVDALVRATILVAKAKQLPHAERKFPTLVLYGHWLNVWEYGAERTSLYTPRGRYLPSMGCFRSFRLRRTA